MIKSKRATRDMTAEYNDISQHAFEQREARHKLCQRFMHEVLLSGIREATIASREEVLSQYRTFQQENPGLGDDFELGSCWWSLWKQHLYNDCLAKNAPGKLIEEAKYVDIA